jgi:hypothetical protein
LLAAPGAAVADPMPAGNYDLATNPGGVQIGGLLPSVPVPAAGPFAVGLTGQPVQLSLPSIATIPGTFNTSIPGGTLSGSYTINVPSANLSVDPATGSATLDVSLYVSISMQAVTFFTASASCTIGDAGHPVTLHLTTDAGAPWAAATGNFALADKTFVVPSPTCDNSTVGAIFALLMGGTSSGDNSAQVTGNATKRPDATPTTTTGGDTTTGTGTTSGQPTTPTTTTTPGTTAPQCVVPKLKSKSLKQIKKALKKAHCRLGKVKRVKSQRKSGTVVKQKFAAGQHLPAGTKVPVTVARG